MRLSPEWWENISGVSGIWQQSQQSPESWEDLSDHVEKQVLPCDLTAKRLFFYLCHCLHRTPQLRRQIWGWLDWESPWRTTGWGSCSSGREQTWESSRSFQKVCWQKFSHQSPSLAALTKALIWSTWVILNCLIFSFTLFLKINLGGLLEVLIKPHGEQVVTQPGWPGIFLFFFFRPGMESESTPALNGSI